MRFQPLLVALVTLGCSCSPKATSTPKEDVRVAVVPPAATVPPEGTYVFRADVTGAANTAVVWSVDQGLLGGTVGAGGLYTAPATAGAFTVRATSVEDDRRSGTAAVTVSGGSTGFAISPTPVAVAAGGVQQFTVSPPAVAVTWRVERSAPVAFPLAVSANGRYLVDQNAVPFRIHGDSAWSLIANLTMPEVERYLADRKARGFNTLLVNLLEHKFAINAPRNRAGNYPFTQHAAGAYDFSTPDASYFTFVDGVLDRAATLGFLVLLSPMYAGYNGGDEGWWTELTNGTNTQAKALAYGQFLGARYKNRQNLMWILSGDYTPPAGSEGEARLLKILEGIRSAGANQLASAHCSPGENSSFWTAFRPSLQVNGSYGYGLETYTHGRDAYAYAPATPAFYFEGGYEAEGWVPGDPASMRSYAWWGQLTTTGGNLYGHRDVWPFQTGTWGSGFNFGNQPWTQSLDAPGARAMSQMASLLATTRWHELVPSGLGGMKTLVTAGAGSGTGTVAAAATPDGSLLLAYAPAAHSGSLTVDLTALTGTIRARWWDPTSGAFTSAGTFAATGTQAFTPPAANAAGDGDWLLVLDTGLGPSCGSIGSTGLYSAPPSPPSPATCRVVAHQVADPSVTAAAEVTISP